MKVIVPPIKSQGIKTKLVSWIKDNTDDISYDRWIEPFMGTGVVAFNIRPKKAILCDSNPHIIKFYQALQNKEINALRVRQYLNHEGQKLLDTNGEHYYKVRDRFNEKGSPLDFLFLSRSCFNGMMRFNRKGGFNVPFCKKPNRFAQALITKITNQVDAVGKVLETGDYVFKNQDFQKTLNEVYHSDLIYSDPPYIGRHVDYFDSWSEEEEKTLKLLLLNSKAKFVISTWLSNKYRTNEFIFSLWKDCHVSTKEHFYHVGGKESNRNAVYEALLSNIKLKDSISNSEMELRIRSDQPQLTTKKIQVNSSTQLSLDLRQNGG